LRHSQSRTGRKFHLTSIRRLPSPTKRTMPDSRGSIHARSARLVAFPTRSHTMSGAGDGVRSERAASFCSAWVQRASSLELRRPASSTCTAWWPASHNHCAKAGGNCASTTIFTLPVTIPRDLPDARHTLAPPECLPAQGRENFLESLLRSRHWRASLKYLSRGCACRECRAVRRTD